MFFQEGQCCRKNQVLLLFLVAEQQLPAHLQELPGHRLADEKPVLQLRPEVI